MQRDFAGLAIKRIQAHARGNPEGACPVFAAGFDIVAAQTEGIGRIVTIEGDLPGCGIQSVQALGRRQPQDTSTILGDVFDSIHRIMCKPLSRWVELVEELIDPDPDVADLIFEKCVDEDTTQAVPLAWIVREGFELGAIVPV